MYNGYRVFPGCKEGPGRDADPSPLLVPWSWKSRAIPLLPLWTVRPVQSLSACTRVHFSFTLPKLQDEKWNERKCFRKIAALWSRQRNVVHIHLEFSCSSLSFFINVLKYFPYIFCWHSDTCFTPLLIFNVSPFLTLSTCIAIYTRILSLLSSIVENIC